MTTIVIVYLFLLGIGIFLLMLVQYLRGTHDLMSVRNALLFGFAIWMPLGGAQTLLYGERRAFILEHRETTAVIFAAMTTVILLVFLWSYKRGFFVKRLATRVPTTQVIPSTNALWTIAIGLLAVGVLMRFGFVPLPRQVLNQLSVTLPAVACGIAAWIWAPRLFNPFVAAMVVVIVVISALTVTTGAFGRRPLVTVGAALMWGLYFSHFRYQPPSKALPKFALIALVPIVFVAMYTSVRSAGEKGRTGLEHVQAIQDRGDALDGLQRLAGGQGAAGNSMWLIEQYPMTGGGRFETRPLFTAYYAIVLPFPRALWEGKPDAMSQRLPHMAAVTRVDRANIKLSVGIVGHAAAEGGWFALLIYGLLGGLLIRFFDEILQNNLWSPFIVLALGSYLGHVFGITRGETAVMTTVFVVGTVLTYIVLLGLGKMLEGVYGQANLPTHHDTDPAWPEHAEYDEFVHHGDYDDGIKGGDTRAGLGDWPGTIPTR